MTLPANQDLVAALRKIGQGLLDLADVLPGAPDEPAKPKPRSVDSSPKASPPPTEEPSEDEANDNEEIQLADLQTMAKDLIKKGKRDDLREILEEMKLETVSSAPKDKWAELKEKLEAVE